MISPVDAWGLMCVGDSLGAPSEAHRPRLLLSASSATSARAHLNRTLIFNRFNSRSSLPRHRSLRPPSAPLVPRPRISALERPVPPGCQVHSRLRRGLPLRGNARDPNPGPGASGQRHRRALREDGPPGVLGPDADPRQASPRCCPRRVRGPLQHAPPAQGARSGASVLVSAVRADGICRHWTTPASGQARRRDS